MNQQQVTLVDQDGLKVVVFNKWQQDKAMTHCFTTKLGGVSTGDLTSLNLGFNRGDQRENVVTNYQRVCDALHVPLESLVLSKQVHETNIVEVTKEHRGNGITYENQWESVDGIYTREKDVTLVTHYADCVPLFFYAQEYGIIGMAHAGWRGTVGEIGAKMVKEWHDKYNIPFEAIEVAIGPSIGACCFEVHEDVYDAFKDKFGHADFIAPSQIKGKYHINLWECNKQSLMKMGILEKNIILANTCTCCNDQVFYSHRKTQGKRGTLAGIMALR